MEIIDPEPGNPAHVTARRDFLRTHFASRGETDAHEAFRRKLVKETAIQARRRLYEGTVRIDAIIRAGGDVDALAAALKPFIAAANLLPGDAE